MHNRGLLKYKLDHVLFWMLLFGLWFMFRHSEYRNDSIAFTVTLIKVVDLAVLVYITNYVLLPQLFYRKKYVGFAIVLLLMIMGSSLLKMQILGNYLNDPRLLYFGDHWKARVYDNFLPHLFLVIAGAAIKLMFDYAKMQQRLVEIAKEKAETELNFLKSQINPHFLFNSLNSVYFLIKKDNPEAREALHKFSEMLRYQLYEMSGDKIPIEKEITYLEDYVALQQLRKDEGYSVQFNCDDNVKGFSIEPLLLIPFVENAFKHISHNNDKNNFVKLDISRSNGTLSFKVENSKEAVSQWEGQQGGIGLVNVKRRLELLYPEKHELKIEETAKTYSVKLDLSIPQLKPQS
ncbi:MAG TPA: histidine kinase [Chitinophagaceae bacterium]